MNLLSIFSKFAGRKSGPQVAIDPSNLAVVDAVFHHILTLLTSPAAVKEIFTKYDEVRRLPSKQREQAIIQVYFTLESFITETKPVISKIAYTIESLRKEIRDHVSLEGLGNYFGLVFLSESEQAIVLYTLGLREILNFMETHMAARHTEQAFAQATKGTLLSGMTFTTAMISQESMRSKLAGAQLPSIITAFRAIYEAASTEIAQGVGDKQANELFKGIYNFVKATYSFDLVGLFMDILPKQLFESERLGMLSREELERNVIMRTRELSSSKGLIEEKLSEIEAKNQQLEETKQAVLNVLDDEKRLRGELQSERDQAQAILTAMGEGLYVVSRNHTLITINQAAQNMLAVDAKDVIGRQWPQFVEFTKNNSLLAPDQWPETTTLTRGISASVGIDDNVSIRKGNGDDLPVSLNATPLTSDGEVIGAVVVFADITRNKKEKEIIEATVETRTRQLREKTTALELANAQIKSGWEALEKEKAKLASSINSLSLGFIMTDQKGYIVMVNPQARKILDIGKDIKNLSQIDANLGEKCNLTQENERCHQEKSTIHVKELPYGTKYVSIFLAPIISTDLSEDLGTVILVEDITERKIMERSRDEFFSIASHELRTPLTVIRGNTSLILQYYGDKIKDKQVTAMLTDTHDSSIRLIGIVNDFLHMSRLELGKIVFAKEVFDLSELVGEVIKELKAPFAEKKLSLLLQDSAIPFGHPGGKPLPRVLADRIRAKEVLINLIGNASKNTTVGGVTLAIETLGREIKVLVTDTGGGIAPANQALLFRKFQQAGDSLITRNTAKGTGLGLYISKLMVEGMGGKIALEHSELGKGSTFSFTLPAALHPNISEINAPNTTLTQTPADDKTTEAVVATTPTPKPTRQAPLR